MDYQTWNQWHAARVFQYDRWKSVVGKTRKRDEKRLLDEIDRDEPNGDKALTATDTPDGWVRRWDNYATFMRTDKTDRAEPKE